MNKFFTDLVNWGKVGLHHKGVLFSPPICEECGGWPMQVIKLEDGFYYAECLDCGWGVYYVPEKSGDNEEEDVKHEPD